MYQKHELLEIYRNAKAGIITHKELLPIRNELIFVIKKTKFEHLYAINDLIMVLQTLQKENKLSIVNQELIDFIKTAREDTYLPAFLYGITYENTRLTDDILENEEIISSLSLAFYLAYKALIRDYTKFNYLDKINNVFANVAIKYLNMKDKLDRSDYSLQDMYILSNVLERIITMVYINIDSYDYDYEIIKDCMEEIENNIIEYFLYFIENQLWCIDYGLTPKSLGGFKSEFIVIGNIVNKIYDDKQKKIKMSK